MAPKSVLCDPLLVVAIAVLGCAPATNTVTASDGVLRLEAMIPSRIDAATLENGFPVVITNVSKTHVTFVLHPLTLTLSFVNREGKEVTALNDMSQVDFINVTPLSIRTLGRGEAITTDVRAYPRTDAPRGSYQMRVSLKPAFGKIPGVGAALVAAEWHGNEPLVVQGETSY